MVRTVEFSNDQLTPQDRSDIHPIIGSLISANEVDFETKEPMLDTPEQLAALERRHQATEFVEAWYKRSDLSPTDRALATLYQPMHSVAGINNQFATKIMPHLMNPDLETARTGFLSIAPNTSDEEMLLLTNDEQFDILHGKLQAQLANDTESVQEAIAENQKNIRLADRMEFNGVVNRSLENMMERGMKISIDPNNVACIKKAHGLAGQGILPITEYVKNSKVLSVSDFMGSKISLAVHDFMDHIWTFDLAQRTGLLDRYSAMFDSIGNPEATDIFKREGEIVASIGFGVRYFDNMPSAFGPLMRSSSIEAHLDKLLVSGRLESRHMEAYRTIKGLRKGSMEWQSLGFSFSNYITELDEQRRKYGTVKQRDPRTLRVTGELDPMSPDYLCFFIDVHHQLLSSHNKHRNDLFRFHILFDEYLTAIAEDRISPDEPLRIKPGDLRSLDFQKTTLPAQRLMWMRNNYGFTATRDAIL